jgi:hypothetical protein
MRVAALVPRLERSFDNHGRPFFAVEPAALVVPLDTAGPSDAGTGVISASRNAQFHHFCCTMSHSNPPLTTPPASIISAILFAPLSASAAIQTGRQPMVRNEPKKTCAMHFRAARFRVSTGAR